MLTAFLITTNEIKISDVNFIEGFFLLQIIVFLFFSIFIPYIAYKILKSTFNYNLSFFFQSSVTFTQGVMILYVIFAYATYDMNFPTSEFLWAYAVLFMFLYFVFMNLLSVIRNFKEAKEETKLKDTTKIGMVIISGLIFIVCLIFIVLYDYQFIKEIPIFELISLFLIPFVFLYGFYKLLFKKEITGRNFAYLPVSIFIINIVNILNGFMIITAADFLLHFDFVMFPQYNIIFNVISSSISCFLYIGTLKLMSSKSSKILKS